MVWGLLTGSMSSWSGVVRDYPLTAAPGDLPPPVEAIHGVSNKPRLEHLRGIALNVRNLNCFILLSLIPSGHLQALINAPQHRKGASIAHETLPLSSAGVSKRIDRVLTNVIWRSRSMC